MKDYPFSNFGGNGQMIHFGSANGFHPQAYKQLLESLTEKNEVIGMHFRPFWENSEPSELKNWKDLVGDLIGFLEAHNKGQKVIGMGHSFGASLTIMAAHKRPDLFEKLVLIEPVLLPKIVFITQKILPLSVFRKTVPPAKTAKNRTDIWDSKQAAYDYLRPKRVFKRIPDEVFKEFIDAAIIPNKEGKATLSFSKAWEEQVFATVGNIWPLLPKLNVPTLALRGAKTDTIRKGEWAAWQRIQANATFENIEGLGHLLPLENPTLIAQTIKDFIED